MFKPHVPKSRFDLSIRLRDIPEKRVPAKLKPIVGTEQTVSTEHREFASKVWGRVASKVSSIQEAPGGQDGPGDSIP